MFRVKPGMKIRTRRMHGERWYYGVVIQQDESGLIHLRDTRGFKRELTSIDAEWMHSKGNLQVKEES